MRSEIGGGVGREREGKRERRGTHKEE